MCSDVMMKSAVALLVATAGLICCATRNAVRHLDTCDTIYNIVWEGAIAKRFQPFWWSPITALTDMSEEALAFENGQFVNTPRWNHHLHRVLSWAFFHFEHNEKRYRDLT